MPAYPIEKQSTIITACVALHNFIRDNAEQDVDFATSMPEVEVQVHGNQGTTGDGVFLK
jgi:hypothetical protein